MVELLVVMGIMAVLAGIAVPVGMKMVKQGARVACLGQLRSIGVGLESYLMDHNDHFPEVEMARRTTDEDVPTLELALAPYLSDREVFHCPADHGLYAASGSSYLWNSTQSGRHKLRTSFFGTEGEPEHVPLVMDKESFHGGASGVNMLYADYHLTNQIEFHAKEQ